MKETQFNRAQDDKAMTFAFGVLKQLPKDDSAALEAHLTATLIVFMCALWGTFGTEFSRGFIEAQLNSMESESGLWTLPKIQ